MPDWDNVDISSSFKNKGCHTVPIRQAGDSSAQVPGPGTCSKPFSVGQPNTWHSIPHCARAVTRAPRPPGLHLLTRHCAVSSPPSPQGLGEPSAACHHPWGTAAKRRGGIMVTLSGFALWDVLISLVLTWEKEESSFLIQQRQHYLVKNTRREDPQLPQIKLSCKEGVSSSYCETSQPRVCPQQHWEPKAKFVTLEWVPTALARPAGGTHFMHPGTVMLFCQSNYIVSFLRHRLWNW